MGKDLKDYTLDEIFQVEEVLNKADRPRDSSGLPVRNQRRRRLPAHLSDGKAKVEKGGRQMPTARCRCPWTISGICSWAI